MSLIFYDTEFLEDGRTIELISIGMVAEDGRELYAVNKDAPWRRIKKHDWLMANVVPHLPQGHGDYRNHMPRSWVVDFADERVKPKTAVADEVRGFLDATPAPELWAYYGAYDHVVLAQLFGPMVERPASMPMWTNDIMQLLTARGSNESSLPAQPGNQHNALADARWVKSAYEWLAARP